MQRCRVLQCALALLPLLVAPEARAFTVVGEPRANVDQASEVAVPLLVTQVGSIQDLNLQVEIRRPYADNVDLWLRHEGVTVQVYDAMGDTQDSAIDAVFDDEAAGAYPANGSVTGAVRAGPDLLAAFDGLPLQGVWELVLQDTIEPRDGTSLLFWALSGTRVHAGPPRADVDQSEPVVVPLEVNESGTITDLDLEVEIGAPNASELDIRLRHGGVTIQVFQAAALLASSIDAVFDDEAQAPGANGRVLPAPDALAAFDGMPLSGTWELVLQDTAGDPLDGSDLLGFALRAEVAAPVLGAETFVSPPARVDTEGESNDLLPFSSLFCEGSCRYQQVYGTEALPEVPVWITGLAFRPDGLAGAATSGSTNNIDLRLSTTSAAPDALSTSFADNPGADVTTVYSGALSVATSDAGPEAGPKDFDVVIELRRPFRYDPRGGSLLLDVLRYSGGSLLETALDAGSSGDAMSRLWVSGVAGATGTADTAGLVTRFDLVPVPEPGRVASIASALLALLGLARRRRAEALFRSVPAATQKTPG